MYIVHSIRVKSKWFAVWLKILSFSRPGMWEAQVWYVCKQKASGMICVCGWWTKSTISLYLASPSILNLLFAQSVQQKSLTFLYTLWNLTDTSLGRSTQNVWQFKSRCIDSHATSSLFEHWDEFDIDIQHSKQKVSQLVMQWKSIYV